jgi:hypothetical protein
MEVEDSVERSPAPPADPHWQPPRLGIIHFLAWPLAAAFLFCAASARADLEWSWMKDLKLFRCLSTYECILMAAGVVGLAVIVRQALLGQIRGRLQPGHWLVLVVVPARISLGIAMLIVLLCTQSSSPWGYRIYYPMCSAAYYLYCLAILLVAARRNQDRPRWRVFFRVLALLTLLCVVTDHALRYIAPPIDQLFLARWSHQFISGPLILIAASWVAITDRHVRRDWLHFLGLGLIANSGFLEVAEAYLFRTFLGSGPIIIQW